MKSRLLLNLVLLVIVIMLGFIIANDDVDNDNKVATFSSIDAKTIDTIVITHGDRIIELIKTNGRWVMNKPIDIGANQFRIASLLRILSSNSYSSYPADSLDLGKFGLATPKTHIKLNQHKLSFGIANPINNYRYVLFNNKVHLLDDEHLPLLSSQIGTLVAFNLLPDDTVINKLILPESTLERNVQGAWSSNKGYTTDAIEETLANWKSSLAFGVHNYLKRKNLGSIAVHTNNNEIIHFDVTDIDPWLVIARPDKDIEYHFNSEAYDQLLRPGNNKIPDDIPHEISEEITKAANN